MKSFSRFQIFMITSELIYYHVRLINDLLNWLSHILTKQWTEIKSMQMYCNWYKLSLDFIVICKAQFIDDKKSTTIKIIDVKIYGMMPRGQTWWPPRASAWSAAAPGVRHLIATKINDHASLYTNIFLSPVQCMTDDPRMECAIRLECVQSAAVLCSNKLHVNLYDLVVIIFT